MQWRLVALAVGVHLFVGLIVGAAAAQVPDVGSALSDPGPEAGIDTEYTPVAKETQLWNRVGGLEFGEHEIPVQEGSPTPLSADFFAVSFRNLFNGFIGGNRCEDRDAEWEELEGCTRVPAIYRYSQEPGREGEIEEVFSAPGQGYVAAITWLGPDRALAVGGSGTYPRREPSAAEADVPQEDPTGAPVSLPEGDPAGEARAWLYQNGQWEEITGGLPTGMGALTALDAAPDPFEDCGPGVTECAFAGGLRQIWRWDDGAFTDKPFTPTSTDENGEATVANGAGWLFRVRQLSFSPEGGPTAVAVTSGCCHPNPANDVARILVYDAASERWDVRLLYESRYGIVGQYQTLPDSYYAFTFAGKDRDDLSVLASPGGPERDGESGSRIVGVSLDDNGLDESRATDPFYLVNGYVIPVAGGNAGSPLTAITGAQGSSDIPYELANPNLSSARLAVGDGDLDYAPRNLLNRETNTSPTVPDGLMDWAVGVLRSSGQGVAYTTAARARGADVPLPLSCPGGEGVRAISTECQPDANAAEEEARSRTLFALPTYALNDFELIGSSGVGWAVGDKGAVMRLGGEGTVGSAAPPPPPPRLGGSRRTEPAASHAYDDFRTPQTGPHGPVPALAGRPVNRLGAPQFLAAGSPDTRPADGGARNEVVRQIVMSRDGSEGWAIGPGNDSTSQKMTLYHYSGGRWERCRVESLEGLFEPDPACAELAPLWLAGVRLTAAVRVPLERDEDPTNDDEFEVMAAGTQYADPENPANTNLIVRYRDGRWEIDWHSTREIATRDTITDIAFVRPDDGWLLANRATSSDRSIFLYHFDGNNWAACDPGALECGDAQRTIPYGTSFGSLPFRLALAGERLYIYGTVFVGRRQQGTPSGASPRAPVILYKEPGGPWRADEGGYDPAGTPGAESTQQGELYSLSVVKGADGRFSGWAVGRSTSQGRDPFLRLDPSSGEWEQVDPGSIGEYLPPNGRSDRTQMLTFLDARAEERSVLAVSTSGSVPLLTHDGESEREPGSWKVLPTPFTMAERNSFASSPGNREFRGVVRALAPDGGGGFWMAAEGDGFAPSTYFYHWTEGAPEPVFRDVAHPIREPITSAAAGPDGRVWVSTASNRLYTYDRVTGWDSVGIAGWDPGRVVTRASSAAAVAIGPDGNGVVAGENGRIAVIDSGAGVTLDTAATLSCGEAGACSTTQDLHAAAVAPDGSAMVGGDRRALAWRPPDGGFRTITPPPTSLAAQITGISLPGPDRAWVTTDTGDVFRGERAGADFVWHLESLTPDGDPLALNLEGKRTLALNAISVDSVGAGYAVGDDGMILERDPDDGATPWRRVDAGYLDDFQSLFYTPGGATLIGGESGLVLAKQGSSFEVARSADFFDPLSFARGEANAAGVVAVTAASGPQGAVEAWAFTQASSSNRPSGVLHFSSDPSSPLLSPPEKRTDVLPDSARPSAEALNIAAFGKSDCQLFTGPGAVCPEPTGSNLTNEVIMRRVSDEIMNASRRAPGSQIALFSGDVDEFAGSGNQRNTVNSPIDSSVVHHRWAELVADPLAQEGVPLFAAIGGGDLSHTQACTQLGFIICASTHESKAGPNFGWRQALAGMAAPWGTSGDHPSSSDGLEFDPVEAGGPKVEPGDTTVEDPTQGVEDPTVEDPTGEVGDQTVSVPHPGGQTVPTGGAHTHYAFDVVRDGRRLARVAVVDSSLRSLTGSDPLQNPIEGSGQLTWLADVLCRAPEETATGEPCSREAGQRAIVVSNTPTYSYGPGALNDTQTDGTALESVLLANDVDLVISGRLGWNGVYWALAPGLHYPCPGGSYHDPNDRENPPPPVPNCTEAAPSEAEQAVGEAQRTVGDLVGGGGGAAKALPFVVAASAGGKFGPDGTATGSATEGFWHGYTIVHLDPDTGEVSVEQRPVFDWIGIEAKKGATRVLRAGKRLELLGYGREPVGMDQPARYDEISTAAITHRFDLLAADPDEPWLPKEAGSSSPDANPCHPYECLPSNIGQINRQSGEVRAGKGNYPRTYAVAQLSVDDHSTTYPLVFEPRASFQTTPPPPAAPVAVAPPPPPPAPAQPTSPSVNLPAAPVLPVLTAQALAPPPVPPSPPTFASQAPLDLGISPASLDVAPPTAVSQPPTPPVNPAPPSGARREARQRQAAAQKSGADSGDEQEEGADASEGQDRVQLMDSPDQASSRLDHGKDHLAFRALSARDQPSAWARNALIGGGLGLAALLFALGVRTARPTPRRREPELPAPAWAKGRPLR